MSDVYERLETLLRSLGVKKTELRIYRLLLEKKRPMRVTEIVKELGISERSVREHVLSLYRRGMLRRELIQQGWLGYTYTAVSPSELLENLKRHILERINEIEKELRKE
ncbi:MULTISPECIES: transcriptional regulator [Thermococcus]|uniref:Putative transcription regulator containing HTH domain n=1 Tax=Thermococcus nautili TaxID=195522 RepID=W8NWL7_9EURY|nr:MULTISPECIES: transcriptional regulator [Thermococcus]AHL23602.1 putative transcription regulator containing HTH domain [Thermococcus nautili]NJE49329.1 transcriptional regulator [Thermococcus sp. 9N3]CAI1492326.1 Putative transcription regulator containing HTH domain [Thermococcus nautili]